MTGTLVSILIPAYNAEATLAATLESALAQTWPSTQVVVVDDGSSDNTLAVAQAYRPRGVTVVAQPENQGQTATLNRAMAAMSPEAAFVQFLDADDVISPTKIEEQMRRLLSEPPRTLATCAWGRFYDDNPLSAVFVPRPDQRDYEQPIEWLIDDWTGRGTMPPGAWLFPRAVVDAVGPWNEQLTLNNDMEYFTRAVLEARRIVYCENARLYYRSGHVNLSGRRDPAALASQREVIRLSGERLRAREDSPRTRHAAACYWQTLATMAYPANQELAAEAEATAYALGGSPIMLDGGRLLKVARRVLGWRTALRLQRVSHRLRRALVR